MICSVPAEAVKQEGEGLYSSLKAGRSIVSGMEQRREVAALNQCPDSDGLRSCLWPEVLEGTLELRTFDTQLHIDLRDSWAVVP